MNQEPITEPSSAVPAQTKRFRDEEEIDRDLRNTRIKLDGLEEELRVHPNRIKKVLDDADIPSVVHQLVDSGYLTKLYVSTETTNVRTVAAGCAVVTKDEWSCELELEGKSYDFFATMDLGEDWEPDFTPLEELPGDDEWEALVRDKNPDKIALAIVSTLYENR